MRLILDVMGNDLGVDEVVLGGLDAIEEYGIDLIFVGDESQIKNALDSRIYPKEKVEIVGTSQVIENTDEPALAIRRKKDASIVVASRLLKEGRGDGLLSSGSTGASLAAGIFIIGRIKGVDRPAISLLYPTYKGFSLLIDGGANVDTKAININQFALMGSIYMEEVNGIKNPKVGLLNIGEEEGKGNQLVKESYSLLKESDINFIGNIEGKSISKGDVDVILCDGFVGNIALKVTEGIVSLLFTKLKDKFMTNLRTKLGALLLKKELKELIKEYDYREHGGAPLLGVSKAMVISHGSSDRLAIKNGLRQLVKFIDKDLINKIESKIGGESNDRK